MKKLLIAVCLIFASTLLLCSNKSAFAAEDVSHGGEIIYTKPLKSVIFSHKVHVEDKGLGCDRCHSGLFEAEALKAQENPDFNMESLYKGKYCGACHDGKTAFASNTQCARCHTGVKGYVASQKGEKAVGKTSFGPKEAITLGQGASAVKFMHESHKLGCSECHSKIFPMKKGESTVTMDAIYKGKYCGACHNGKKAFASEQCIKCHSKVPPPEKSLTYKVKGVGPVNFSHKFHTAAFKCDQCHPKVFAMKKTQGKMTMDAMNNGKFCGSCHNGNMASAVSDCGKCHKS
jgi:c(7)-type cytochrome triheme protein